VGNWLRGALRAVTVPVLATVAGMLVGTIFILSTGHDPFEAYSAFFEAIAGSPYKFGETLVNTIPLIFTGLAVALAFRCGLFNIGLEGQYLVAALATAWAGSAFEMHPLIHAPFAILVGMIAGAFWAAIPGFLKAYRGIHEVINAIMLNYIGWYLTHWLVMGALRDPSGSNSTAAVHASARFAQGMIERSRLHSGLWIALVAAFLVWVFLWKTPAGYEIRAVGFSPGAAEYGGISVKRNIILAMALSGSLTGLAAAVQTLGIAGKFYEPLGFIGFGFDGIAVALVGQNHPLGVVLSALLFGSLERGGAGMNAAADIPKTVIQIVQGTVIFFVAVEGLWRYFRNRRAKKEVKTA